MSEPPAIRIGLEPWLVRHATTFRDRSLGRLAAQRAAVTAGDHAALRVFGHNLRGMGATYGMDEVSRIGRQLEVAAASGEPGPLEALLDELEAWLRRVDFVPA